MHIQTESFADFYTQVRKELLLAKNASPRGMMTRELLHVTLHLTNPRNRLAYHQQRGYSLPFAVAESILLFDSTNTLAPIAYINPRMRQFSDNGTTMHGAYGYRIASFIPDIIRKLQTDPDTRQAVLSIHKLGDLLIDSADIPCTCSLQFFIRENRLHLMVTMRSNDLFWGTQYDVFVFTVLQEVLANTLGIDVGEYWHVANSLHVYERHFALLESIAEMEAIACVIPYDRYQMQDLAVVVKQLHLMSPDDFADTASNPFEEILKFFLVQKKYNQILQLSSDLCWAEKFLYKQRLAYYQQSA